MFGKLGKRIGEAVFGKPYEPTEEDLAVLKRVNEALAAAALPAVGLDTVPRRCSPMTSGLGGAAWRPDGVAWPRDRRGEEMLFLAQVNFSELPKLPDFPETGLLQLFVDAEELGLGGWIYPESLGDVHIDYWENPAGGEAVFGDQPVDRPPFTRAMPREGVSFAPRELAPMNPDINSWIWEAWCAENVEKWAEAKVDSMHSLLIERAEFGDESTGEHCVGGHPIFVQNEVRGTSDSRKLDRIALRLGCDDFFDLVDSGSGNVLISQESLRDRKFDKSVWTFDFY